MLGLMERDDVLRVQSVVDSFGLPSEMPAHMDMNGLLSSIQLDKKAVAGELKFILPEKIGSVRIYKGVTEKSIKEVLQS